MPPSEAKSNARATKSNFSCNRKSIVIASTRKKITMPSLSSWPDQITNDGNTATAIALVRATFWLLKILFAQK